MVLLISGYDPLAAYSAMLSGAFSNARHIGDVLEYAMVLCLCGVACDIGSVSYTHLDVYKREAQSRPFAVKRLICVSSEMTAMPWRRLYSVIPSSP